MAKLLCSAILHIAVQATSASADLPETPRVTDASITPSHVVQGDPIAVTYRVTGGGPQLSATAFARRGALDGAPKRWDQGAVRFEPKYQITRQDMRGKAKRLRCTLPGSVTRELAAGPHTLFVAVSNPPTGWTVVKLGEVVVSAFEHIDVPRRTGPARVAIWKDDVQAEGVTSSPDRLAALVAEAGASPTFRNGAQLSDPSSFDRTRFDLLVLPYGGAVPRAALDNLAQFLKSAGAVLCIGGPPFVRPVDTVPQDRRDREPSKLADVEHADATARLPIERGPKTVGQIERHRPGASGTQYALRAHVSDLADWFYVAVPLKDTGDRRDGVISFWAKGDAYTDKLCLELVEEDGSRWKYFVRLAPGWRQYSVQMERFAVYASPARSALGDRFRPEKAVRLKLGLYRALFEGTRPRTFWIDEVERRADLHEPEEPLSAHLAEWAAQYAYLRARPPAQALGVVQRLRRVSKAAAITAAPDQHIAPSDLRLTRSVAGWEVTPITWLRHGSRWSSGTTRCARHVPLLTALDANGRPVGTLASLVMHYRGPYRGAALAFFSIDSEDMLDIADPALIQTVVRAIRALTERTFVFDVEPRFAPKQDKLVQTWQICAANLTTGPRTLSVNVSPHGQAGARTKTIALDAGGVQRLSIDCEGATLDPMQFGVRVRLECRGEVVDELVARATALDGLSAAGNWILANQKPEGQFSRFYYADTYGARALRVLGKLTGRTAYTDAGLRLADMLVRDQRDDGGWWVGYGPPGECVFVADDGCIALALVQLAPYVDGHRRQAYLQAARNFIRYRESFRITDEVARSLEAEYGRGHKGILLGGLGVGYVRTDYFAGGRYPKAHREMRQFPWTLHCSLAFLGGLHAATEDSSYRALAVQDTNWFLARVAEAKDSVTSPYANEAAVWILDTIDDPGIQRRLREELTKCFGQAMAKGRRTWWTSSGGRGALLLPGLVYCSRCLPPSAARQAALLQAVWSLCAESSPLSIQNTIERHPTTTNGEAVMYICFSSLGLAELLEPRSTLMPK